MSQMTRDGAAGATSVAERAEEKIQRAAGRARGAVREQVSGQIEERSNHVGAQLQDVAEAFRRTGRGLESEGSETPARLVNGLSERAEQLGSYLAASSSDRILHDVEHFGRRNPWLVIAGGVAMGIAASRILKASSNRRFEDLQGRGYSSRIRGSQWDALPAPTSRLP